jgi:recombination associated protein RdgC
MFKNLMLFRIEKTWSKTTAQIEAGLAQMRFRDCGATQEKSIGWSEPRGEKHGMLVEAVGGQLILRLTMEAKVLPASVVKRRADEKIEKIEETTGRKVSRMEKKDIREETLLDLLPRAFTRISNTTVWIDPAARLLVIDAAGQTKADEVVAALLRSLDGLVMTQIQTNVAPATQMAAWLLSYEAPGLFDLDRECELKATDDSEGIVRYSKHTLNNEEVRKHIQNGKRVTKLALTWNGRVSFVLNETMQVKKLKFLEGVFDSGGEAATPDEDRFDADVAIITGELGKLVPELIDALGGEMETS